MDTIKNLKTELTEEYETTKKFLEVFPEGKNDYSPHEKSMKLMDLTTHLVDIFGWAPHIINKTHIEISEDMMTEKMTDKKDLQAFLEKQYKSGIKALENAS